MNAIAIDATGLFGPESVVLRLLFGVTVVMLAALSAVLVFRRQSAALRHRMLGVSIAALLVLPALCALLPAWQLGWVAVEGTSAAGRGVERPVVSVDDGGAAAASESAPAMQRAHAGHARAARAARSTALGNDPVGVPEDAEPSAKRGATQARGALAKPIVPIQGRSSVPVSAPTVLLVVWLGGVLVGLGRMWHSLRATRRLVAGGDVVTEARCRRHLERLARQFGLAKEPVVLESDATVTPLCAGWRRVRVILPRQWRHWSDEHLRAALAHELAHAARRDVAWQLVARVACAVYWFHPLVWLAAWCMRVEREAACDDCVLSSGEQPTQYARLLVRLAAEWADGERPAAATAVAMAAGCRLERRIRAVLRPGQRRGPLGRPARRGLACGVACMLLVVGALSPFGSPPPEVTGASAPATVPADGAAGTTVEQAVESDDPVEADTFPIVGRVVDERGEGVEGVEVGTLVVARFAQPPVTSGADGSFRMDVDRERMAGLMLHVGDREGAVQAFHKFPYGRESQQPPEPVELVLRAAREIPVQVKDASGEPVENAWTAAVVWHIKVAEAATDAAGRALLRVPADAPLQYVVAAKPDHGLDYFVYRRPDEPASDPYKLAPDHAEPLSFVLNGTRAVTVRVRGADGKPMAGVLVYPWYFELPNKGDDLNLSGVEEFAALTDEDGVATFDMMPADNIRKVTFWVRADGYFSPERPTFDPASVESEIGATLVPLVSVTGRVLLPDGRPAEGIEVRAAGDGYQVDDFRGSVRTAEDGTFELRVNPDQYYLIGAGNDQWAAPAQKMVVRADTPIGGLEFHLQKATRVHGKVTIGADRKPMAGRYLVLYQWDDRNSYYQLPENEQLPNPMDSRLAISPILLHGTYTNGDGQFEFFVGPGEYRLTGPERSEMPEFTVAGEELLEVNLHSKGPDRGPISGRVVLATDPDRGVPEARVTGVAMRQSGFRDLSAVSGADGRFEAERELAEMIVFAATAERKLAGITTIGTEDESVVIAVGPTASARGKLIDGNGAPLANRTIEYGVLIAFGEGTFSRRFGGKTTTGDNGAFTAEGLVVGTEYVLEVALELDAEGNPRSWRRGGTVTAREPGVLELGEIVFKESP